MFELATLALSSLSVLPPSTLQDERTVSPSAVMLRYPDVSDDSIVFRYAGDLWLVPREGGTAERITSTGGNESFPAFSPDGSRVAYMADYGGGTDLYVMPTRGGVPQRVTYHPGQEILCDWTPDGEELIYWSPEVSGVRRAARMSTVPVSGGQPTPLPPAYGVFGAIDPSGEWLAYTLGSREFRTWKRYQGGMAQDVWLYNLVTGQARRATDFLGTDAQPMWHGRDLLFVSDRGPEGVLNLYRYDLDTEETEQLTTFGEFGVRFASVGPRDVVFENGGRLYRYDLEANALVAVEVEIPGDRPFLRPQRMELEDDLASAAPGPTGVRAVVEARGELFSVPADEGFTRALTHSSGVAERFPSWSPNGRWIAYFSDRSGEYELTVRRGDGADFEGADEHGERKVSDLGPGWRSDISWAPDSAKLTFTDNAGNLWLAHAADGAWGTGAVTVEKVTQDPSGFPMGASWSPHSDWLVFDHKRSGERNELVHLYELESGTTTTVSSGEFDDADPTFGPDGDYLYYTSGRVFTSPDYGDLDTTWIYNDTRVVIQVPLRADVEAPLAPTNEEEPVAEEESDEASDDATEDGEESSEEEPAESEEPSDEESSEQEPSEQEEPFEEIELPIDEITDEMVVDAIEVEEEESADEDEAPRLEIDLEGFEARGVALPIPRGVIGELTATNSGLVYVRRPARGVDGAPKVCLASSDEWDEVTIIEGVGGYGVTGDGSKLFVMSRGRLGFVSIAAGQSLTDPLDLSGLVAHVDPRAEWEQMLVETWRLFRDYFYDESMHGLDWPAVLERYKGALADATSREDLAFLTGEMMAELNVGHAYNGRAPSRGPDAPDGPSAGLLGADFERVGDHLVVSRLIRGGSYDTDARGPLAHTKVEAGHALIAVNGTPVDPDRAVHAAMLGTAGRTTQLTFASDPADVEGTSYDVVVEPLGDETALRYRDWVDAKRAYVYELSDGKVGYVHVPDTGGNGQNELMRQIQGAMHRDALLVDERWNGGGQIPTRFVELLDRPLTNKWGVRHGDDWVWPPDGHFGPKAMLINGWSGSGGDAFPYYFRQRGLGQLFGRRTWGGLVGLTGNPSLIDGTNHSIPTFGFYELDGTWGIEGHGVDPDVEVIDDPAALARGEDPQLEAAVRHLLEELERAPAIDPARPAAPDRSGSGITEEDR